MQLYGPHVVAEHADAARDDEAVDVADVAVHQHVGKRRQDRRPELARVVGPGQRDGARAGEDDEGLAVVLALPAVPVEGVNHYEVGVNH